MGKMETPKAMPWGMYERFRAFRESVRWSPISVTDVALNKATVEIIALRSKLEAAEMDRDQATTNRKRAQGVSHPDPTPAREGE
jgi:hypothetical protein